MRITNLSETYQKSGFNKEDIIGRLPLGKRIALRLLLPLAHSCTANREASKSLLIRFITISSQFVPVASSHHSYRTIGQFRQAYSSLGEAMSQSGLIHEEGM